MLVNLFSSVGGYGDLNFGDVKLSNDKTYSQSSYKKGFKWAPEINIGKKPKEEKLGDFEFDWDLMNLDQDFDLENLKTINILGHTGNVNFGDVTTGDVKIDKNTHDGGFNFRLLPDINVNIPQFMNLEEDLELENLKTINILGHTGNISFGDVTTGDVNIDKNTHDGGFNFRLLPDINVNIPQVPQFI